MSFEFSSVLLGHSGECFAGNARACLRACFTLVERKDTIGISLFFFSFWAMESTYLSRLSINHTDSIYQCSLD